MKKKYSVIKIYKLPLNIFMGERIMAARPQMLFEKLRTPSCVRVCPYHVERTCCSTSTYTYRC